MSGGISWGELYDALGPCSALYRFVFLTFISIAIFAVLNVVTGVFVESAMQVSQQDREALIQEEMRHKESYVRHVHSIFEEIAKKRQRSSHRVDDLVDVEIDVDMFEKTLKDERMQAFFSALELDISDVNTLFVLLDRDQTGSVDLDEFLNGCMRLKGQAKSLDLAKLQYEVEFVIHQVGLLSQTIRELPDYLANLQDKPDDDLISPASANDIASTARTDEEETTLLPLRMETQSQQKSQSQFTLQKGETFMSI
jgi:hypothetical protein